MTDDEGEELVRGVRRLLAPPGSLAPTRWEEQLETAATVALLRAEVGDKVGAAAILAALSRADPDRASAWLRLRDRVERLAG